ncbi:MAG: hypothetical protein AAGB15_08205 [Pseudomonadota bacterium]
MRFACAILAAILMTQAAAAKPALQPSGDTDLWQIFKSVCIDQYPSYDRFQGALDQAGFEPPHFYIAGEPQPNRWRGQFHVRLLDFAGEGFVTCRATRWHDGLQPKSSVGADGCFGAIAREQTEWESISSLGGWEQNGQEVIVLEVNDLRRCDAFMLVSAEAEA